MVQPIIPAPGRTQPTPIANRSLATELTGALTSTLRHVISSSLVVNSTIPLFTIHYPQST